MRAVRLWSIRNAGWLKKCYAALEGTLALFNSILGVIGHDRLDKRFAPVKGGSEGLFVRLAILWAVHAGRDWHGLPDGRSHGRDRDPFLYTRWARAAAAGGLTDLR